jgi:hypothetical protein
MLVQAKPLYKKFREWFHNLGSANIAQFLEKMFYNWFGDPVSECYGRNINVFHFSCNLSGRKLKPVAEVIASK